MIEKLKHDFKHLFERDKEGSTYDGIVEIQGKINEVIDKVNITDPSIIPGWKLRNGL